MKIKLDENIPTDLVAVLAQLGHEVDTVPQEGLAGAMDSIIWQVAQKERRFLITQDLDFSNITQFAPGTHAGILLVRLNHPARKLLTQKVQAIFQMELVEDWIGCLVVVTESKIRIRRP